MDGRGTTTQSCLASPPNNQKTNLTLQSATRISFWNKKLKPTGRSLWDEGSIR